MKFIEAIARVTFLSDGTIMLDRQAADGTWSTIALDSASMLTAGGLEKGDKLEIGFTGRVAGPVHTHTISVGDWQKASRN